MAKVASRSKAARVAPRLPQGLIDELERRHAGMARHMARAVVTLVRWDTSTGVPPQREAIVKACAAGLDLFLATAKEARPPAIDNVSPTPKPAADYDGFTVGIVDDEGTSGQTTPPVRPRPAKQPKLRQKPDSIEGPWARQQSVDQAEAVIRLLLIETTTSIRIDDLSVTSSFRPGNMIGSKNR